MSIITRYRHVTAVGIRAVRRIVFARFEGGKRVLNSKIMKIADFDQIPLRSRVIYKRKEYILIDRIKRTHEAIIAKRS